MPPGSSHGVDPAVPEGQALHYLYFLKWLSHVPIPGAGPLPLPPGLSLQLWRPGWLHLVPRGVPAYPFALWGLFHLLRVFASRDYAILIVRAGGLPVHRTCLVPAHFRFPFMGPGDLQAAGIWTRPDHRGQGLARLALQELSARLGPSGRILWYMVREDNPGSIRLAEASGFRFAGRGRKQAGLGPLGAFRITEAPQALVPGQD